MAIIFYDHLIKKHEIHLLIDGYGEADNHKNKAKQLVDDIIHQAVVALILEKLDQKKHIPFLNMLHERPYDPEIMQYLIQHIGTDIETEIHHEANRIIEEIKKDFEDKK